MIGNLAMAKDKLTDKEMADNYRKDRDYWKTSFDILMKRHSKSVVERDRALHAWGGATQEHIRLMSEIARLERALRDIGACAKDPQITSRVREELERGES